MVTSLEFARLLQSCGVEISLQQTRALLRTFKARHAEGESVQQTPGVQVSLWKVLARLQVTMPILPERLTRADERARWALSMLRPLASAVVNDAQRHFF